MIIEVTWTDAVLIGIAFVFGSFIGSDVIGFVIGLLKGLGWIK